MKMKKVLMIVAAIALIAGSVNAGPLALIGLYTDIDHSICRADVPAPYVGWTTYVWVQPSDNGMMCAEFLIQNPAWVLNTGTVPNPGNSVTLGDPFAGISICFGTCQTEWTWLYQLTALPTAAGIADYVNVMPHPDSGGILVANCLEGYPIEPLVVFNNLGINQECEVAIANDNASWGAIKSMVSE
jgi:hypothetical protein